MERLRTREAIHYVLYSLDQDLQWYLKRASAKGREDIVATLGEFLDVQVRLLAPFAPFSAEELWERMGNSEMITAAGWPVVKEERIDPAAEESEFLISNLLADFQNIMKVTKISPVKIVVYTSAPWKALVYRVILEKVMGGSSNFGEIMKQLVTNPETARVKTDPKLVQKMMEDILSSPLEARSRRLMLTGFAEVDSIRDGSSLLSSEASKSEVIVFSEEDSAKYDPKGKAKSARPFKPAIYME
jgi:leucyl-tRNA synthetase